MRSLLAVCVLLSAVTLCVPVLATDFPCPQPPALGEPATTASKAFTPHNEYQREYYWVGASLCVQPSFGGAGAGQGVGFGYGGGFGSNINPLGLSDNWNDFCAHPVAVAMISVLINTTLPTGLTAVVASSFLSVTDGHSHAFGLSEGSALYPNPARPFDLTTTDYPPTTTNQYQVLEGLAGEVGTLYNFVGTTDNVTVDLILRSAAPLLLPGMNGYIGIPNLPPPQCVAEVEIDMPNLKTSGVVRWDDNVFFVTGSSFFDRQWGVYPPSLPGAGWIYVGLRIGSSASAVVLLPRIGTTYEYIASFINVQFNDGTRLNGVITNIHIVSTWLSERTGIEYPVTFRLSTTLPQANELYISTLFLDQELGTAYTHWAYEGSVIVRVTNATAAASPYNLGHTSGNGFMELVGYL